ncbi:MAG TPA: UMP kinase [Methanotrichaceae archaeon]|nr:UMP kinase [Methanotrichaceae archaeon]
MIFVYSLGGSILAGRDAESLKEYAAALKNLAQEHQIFVVVGGGKIAREYIEKARALGAGEAFCDLLGIGATKLNAMILIAALGKDVAPEPPETYARALESSAGGKIVVLGGMQPGQTTDAVAALLAEYVHADKMIVATSVDGVYSADPEIDPKAKKFDHMTHSDLVRLSMETTLSAGSRSPVDPLAAKIIERSSIPAVVVYGGNVENLKKAAEGGHSGTEIS